MIKTRIFKNKWFVRFARKEGVKDAELCEAIRNVEKGLIDADLGGGVIKQRIARPHEGKSGGYRSIVLFNSGEKAFFVFGYAKKDWDNITKKDQQAFKDLAEVMFDYDDVALGKAIKGGAIVEVKCDEKEVSK